ncbi:unnamed protein product [Phaedon cochleariae]|uniref:Uncharacterized protein n=1 Tax=Phaedon cochleariae TaxID=80249 RepID=A0A9N9SLV5_PHACE|nr:unnamed protein product [Phaedon cochleariae]
MPSHCAVVKCTKTAAQDEEIRMVHHDSKRQSQKQNGGSKYIEENYCKLLSQLVKTPDLAPDDLRLVEHFVVQALYKTLDALLKTYNENGILLTLINVSPEILRVMKTITDTQLLSLCGSTDEINIIVDNKSEEEKALLYSAAPRSRRKSSVKSFHSRRSSSVRRNEDRKLSIYEFE